MKLTDDIAPRLTQAAPHGLTIERRDTAKAVKVAWALLADIADLVGVATLLKSVGARLSMISGSRQKPGKGAEAGSEARELAYHFDLDGDTMTVTVRLASEQKEVPSLTPLFRNASWHEREIMEDYAITVANHPDPRRLFVDESLEPAVLERLIPLSALANAASTKALWERILEKKAGPA